VGQVDMLTGKLKGRHEGRHGLVCSWVGVCMRQGDVQLSSIQALPGPQAPGPDRSAQHACRATCKPVCRPAGGQGQAGRGRQAGRQAGADL
jgi:hypothetical protein